MSTEQRDFFVLGNLGFNLRFLLISLLTAAGLIWQLAVNSLLPGVFFVLAAIVLAWRRNMTLKIQIIDSEVEWQETSEEKWRRFQELQQQSKKWKSSATNLASGFGIAVFILFMAVVFVAGFLIIESNLSFGIIFMVNLVLLSLPVFASGTISYKTRPQLDVIMKSMGTVYEYLSETYPDVEIEPMLGLAEGTQDGREGKIPVDARMMLKLQDQPKNFYGIQINCNLNEVGGTHYPYLYAVVLTAPRFKLNQEAVRELKKDKGLAVEPSTSAEAQIVVIRLKTTKTSGYHTEPKTQCLIVSKAVDFSRALLGRS